MARRFHAIASMTLVAMLLTGCSVGPKYVKPTAPVAPAYKEAGDVRDRIPDWKPAQPSDDRGSRQMVGSLPRPAIEPARRAS